MYDTGEILARDITGEIRRLKAGALFHEGSHDSKLMMCSRRGYDLYLSGNPGKHIQGHNLFGSSDAVGLFLDAGQIMRQAVGNFPSGPSFTGNDFTAPRFTRIDLTRSYRFPTSDHARSWIRDIASTARTRHGGSVLRGSTVYFGQGSQRWQFKIYSKFDEIRSAKKGHKLSEGLTARQRQQLLEWSEGIVRFELTLKALELKDLSAHPDPLATWQSYYDRITFNSNASARDEQMTTSAHASLPSFLRPVLSLWLHGSDLRKDYSKPTFYRHRRQFLELLDIDIASPPPVTAAITSADLSPLGWDPEPIRELLHTPDPAVRTAYGLA